MKKFFKSTLCSFGVLAFVATPLIITAQESGDIFIEDLTDAEFQAIFQEISESIEDEVSATGSVEGVTSCFDYYAFNSVHVNISANVSSTVPGSVLAFSGEIENKNNYPIVNGAVYIKIFKDRSVTEKNANGPDVVDQFIAVRNITLEANQKKMVSFEWQVPAWSEAGNYHAGTFFVSNAKYNLLGLSFSDDIVGNIAPFTVTTSQTGMVSFNKDSVLVNEEPYYFAAFAPHINASDPATISAQIMNTTDVDSNVRVFLKTYTWDAMHEDNLLKEESKVVTIPANSSVPVTFVVNDITEPVYLNELSLEYKDTKSFLNVRFIRDGIDKLRINFPAVDNYPLMPDEETKLFACIHNTANSVVDGTLRLRIEDKNGIEIYAHSWNGAVGGDMIGIMSTFVPTKIYDTFTITAELLQNGSVIETDTIEYSCKDFAVCDVYNNNTEKRILDYLSSILFGAFSIGLLLVLLFIKKKYSKKTQSLSV